MDLFKRIQDLSAIYDDDGPSSTVLESRPMFNERMQFDGGGTPLQKLKQEIVESMKPYAPGVPESKLQIIVKDINLDMTAEEAQASAVANFQKLFGMADGGRAGYEDGGMLVQPSNDGSRPGYAKVKDKFISGSGKKIKAIDDPKKYKIVKKYLNQVKSQKNKKIFLDWSEQIKGKPNPWYEKLKSEVSMTRGPLNELINKVTKQEFPTAYSGATGRLAYAREMTVKSFINYWNQNGMFDGNEKLTKPLEQFVTSKKGTPNNYENINRYFTEWKNGKFEVEGVDRKNLDKGLLKSINNWNPSNKSKRSVGVKQQLTYLNNLSQNLSYDRVEQLFTKAFPDNAQTLQHRLNQLTELKRNGVYNDGTGNPKKIPGIEIGERSGWLKEGYGKGFLGNYGRLIKKADELLAAGESKFANRLYKAADKFFSPTGLFTKAAGEGEHPLSRNMGDGPIGNQLKINSLVSSDLNQFKKFNFDSPVRNLVLEYENPKTTDVRRKEIKLEIENRKKLMNILTEGPNQKGIVDSVKFNYGDKKINASVDVVDIDKVKNFDINEYIARGDDYRKSFVSQGKKIGLIDESGNIIKQQLGTKKLEQDLLKLAGTVNPKCRKAAVDGGRIGLSEGLSPDFCINEGKKVARDLVEKNIKGSPAQNSIIKRLTGSLTNFVKSTLDPKELFDIKKQLFSKGAVSSLLFFDAGIAAYEAAAMGKPIKEAVSNTLTFGSIPRAMGAGMDTPDVLNAKQLLKDPNLSPAGKEYAQLIIDSGNYEQMQSDTTGGMTKKFNEFKEIQDKIKNASTAGRFDYESRLNEVEGAEMAKDDYSPIFGSLGDPLKNRAINSGPKTRGGRGAAKDYKIDLTPLTYKNFKPDYGFTKEQFENAMRKEGSLADDQVYQDAFYKQEVEKPIEFQQLMELPSFRSASEKFAGGGIAKEAGDRSGAMTRSMNPDSQGLSYLFNRVKKV